MLVIRSARHHRMETNSRPTWGIANEWMHAVVNSGIRVQMYINVCLYISQCIPCIWYLFNYAFPRHSTSAVSSNDAMCPACLWDSQLDIFVKQRLQIKGPERQHFSLSGEFRNAIFWSLRKRTPGRIVKAKTRFQNWPGLPDFNQAAFWSISFKK